MAESDQQTANATDPDGAARGYRTRLEKLVASFLGMKYSSGQDLWNLELSLLALQRDIQKAITRSKKGRSTAEREETMAVREALWHARRFADALAWVLFGGNRRLIDTLTENTRVPVLPDGPDARAFLGAVEALTETLGFPLIHDLTDLLRIGDATFFPPHGKAPTTVEIKSDVLETKKEGDTVSAHYQITAVWPADRSPEQQPRTDSKPLRPAPSKRFGRQLQRMTNAHILRNVELGKPTEIDGVKRVIIEGGIGHSGDHWPLLQRLVRKARRGGYASGVAEEATFYIVAYKRDGFRDQKDLPLDRVSAELAASGIFYEDRQRNALWVSSLPDPRQRGPLRYTPYYLYPLPLTSILDILRGRLVILSIMNVGRIVTGLEAAGLKVEMPARRGAMPMSVLTDLVVGDDRYTAELASLELNLIEMTMEARSIDYFVSVAKAMADGIKDQLPELIRERLAQEAAAAS